MFDNIKVKPLNEDPNKILELLNENKYNLEALVMQYDGIIEWYIELLGGKYWGKPNCNEVVLPEIIKLLKTHNYDCEFTETGIYQDGKPIFTLEKVKYGRVIEQESINIKNGENRVMLTGGSKSMVNGQRGMIFLRSFEDFSKLDEFDMCSLSDTAILQIKFPEIVKELELKSIHMVSCIAEGVELNRKVEEVYQSIQDPNKSHIICKMFESNIDEPTISVKIYNELGYEVEDLDDYEKRMRLSTYGSEPSPNEFIEKKSFYNYGESKLTLGNPVKLEPEIYRIDKRLCRDAFDKAEKEEREKKYYYKDYDYERLLANLQSYQRKYSSEARHPLLTRTYIDNWKTGFGETVSCYIKEKLFQDKSRASQ